jgi:hypothetical protein
MRVSPRTSPVNVAGYPASTQLFVQDSVRASQPVSSLAVATVFVDDGIKTGTVASANAGASDAGSGMGSFVATSSADAAAGCGVPNVSSGIVTLSDDWSSVAVGRDSLAGLAKPPSALGAWPGWYTTPSAVAIGAALAVASGATADPSASRWMTGGFSVGTVPASVSCKADFSPCSIMTLDDVLPEACFSCGAVFATGLAAIGGAKAGFFFCGVCALMTSRNVISPGATRCDGMLSGGSGAGIIIWSGNVSTDATAGPAKLGAQKPVIPNTNTGSKRQVFLV